MCSGSGSGRVASGRWDRGRCSPACCLLRWSRSSGVRIDRCGSPVRPIGRSGSRQPVQRIRRPGVDAVPVTRRFRRPSPNSGSRIRETSATASTTSGATRSRFEPLASPHSEIAANRSGDATDRGTDALPHRDRLALLEGHAAASANPVQFLMQCRDVVIVLSVATSEASPYSSSTRRGSSRRASPCHLPSRRRRRDHRHATAGSRRSGRLLVQVTPSAPSSTERCTTMPVCMCNSCSDGAAATRISPSTLPPKRRARRPRQ